jgi:hypothetical protein
MRRDPIEFRGVKTFPANRPAAIANSSRPCPTIRVADLAAANVLDEAFAEYSRIDAGSSPSANSLSVNTAHATTNSDRFDSVNLPTTTRDLIADIASQLDALENQRRQLARLLDGAL